MFSFDNLIIIITIITDRFLYSTYLVQDTTQSTLQYIITPNHWIQYQSCTHSAPSQLPGEHSGQAPLQGCTHATSSDKWRLHPTGYPFIHLGGEQQCGYSVLLKDISARHWQESNLAATLWSRVTWFQSNIPQHLHKHTILSGHIHILPQTNNFHSDNELHVGTHFFNPCLV